MPFTEQITQFINESLKGSSLNDKRFQPGKYIGSTSIAARVKQDKTLEQLPVFQNAAGEFAFVELEDKQAITMYHKVVSNAYTTVKEKSYGDDYVYKCTSEMNLIVFADCKKLRLTHEALEPLIIYGMPQRLAKTLMSELKLNSCLITPVASVMDKLIVFRQEFPQTAFFLKPNHSLFLIRYRIETSFNKNCINACLCGEG